MQVRIAPNEVWPVFDVEDPASDLDPDAVEVPGDLVNDWLNARLGLVGAENRILMHLQRTGQAIPEPFVARVSK